MANDHDLVAAMSESGVNDVFDDIKQDFKYVAEIDKTSGRFRVYGTIAFDVPRGRISFVSGNNDFVRLTEVDIRTDIDLTLRIRLPEIAIPKKCITLPCDGEVCTPKIVLVPEVDIYIPLNLPPITTEISGDGMIVPELDELEKEWELKLQLNPLTADIDLVDIADTMGDLFENIARRLLDDLLGPVGAIVYAIIGEPMEWLIRTVLDIPDDLSEWLRRLLSDTLDLHGLLARFLERITGKIVVMRFDQEMEVLKDELSETTPVTITIADVDAEVTDDRELAIGVTAAS